MMIGEEEMDGPRVYNPMAVDKYDAATTTPTLHTFDK